jgi:hypothetical protein
MKKAKAKAYPKAYTKVKAKAKKVKGGQGEGAYDPQLLQNMQSQRLADDLYNSLNVNCTSSKSDVIDALDNPSSASSGNDNVGAVNYLYIQNIRGGYKKNMASKDMQRNSLDGGCLTCPKGKKNLKQYFSRLVVLMPKLYKDYKGSKGVKSSEKGSAVKKATKVTKSAKATKVTKSAKATKVTKVTKATKVTTRPVVKKIARPAVKKVVKTVKTVKAVKKMPRPVVKRTGIRRKVRGGDRLLENILNTEWLSFKEQDHTPQSLNSQIADLNTVIF